MPVPVSATAATTAPSLPRPRSGGTRTRLPSFWRRLLPVLAALAVVTRLPSFRQTVWNPDEGFLATQARILASGGVLYDTVVDRKPPLLPWLYEAAFALCGDQSLWPVRALAVLAQLLTAVLLAAVARRRWGDRAARHASVLYLLVSIGLNPEDAQAANFEVFTLPWTVAAIHCADRRRWLPAGACVAAAFLTKQPGGAVLLPVLFLLWNAEPGRRGRGVVDRGRVVGRGRLVGRGRVVDRGRVEGQDRLLGRSRVVGRGRLVGRGRVVGRGPALGLLAVGLAAPLLVVAAVTSPLGFVFWTVSGSAAYAAVDGSVLLALGRAAVNAALLAASCAGLLLPVLRRYARRPPDLLLWTAASALAVTTGCHFFGHYFLQLMPPLALLAAAALTRAAPIVRHTGYALCTASCALFLTWGYAATPASLPHTVRVAEEVRAATAPTDRVLIWGIHPEQYWLADRAPATRYLTAGLLTNYSGGRTAAHVGPEYAVPGAWRTFLAELRAEPPALIVDDSRGKPYAPRHARELSALLRDRYRPTARIDGAVFYTLGQPPPGSHHLVR